MSIKVTEQKKDYSRVDFVGSYATAYLINNNSNCKLSMLDYISSIVATHDVENSIKRLNEVLKLAKLVVYVNTSKEDIRDFLHTHFDIYESVQIPCGYNNGYQYHIFLRNTTGVYQRKENMRPSEFKNRLTTQKVGQILKKTAFSKNYRKLSKKAITANILAKL